jgi:hypothetical protein
VSKSDFLEAEILDHVIGNAAYSPPATLHLALFTAAPSDSGGGTEVAAGDYGRLALTNNATNFPAASGTSPTTKTNGVAFTFPAAVAAWGTIVAWALMTAATGGNILYHGAVSPSKAVGAGDVAEFAAGALTITED